MEMPLTNQRPAGAGAELGAQRTPGKQRQRREGAPRSKEWRRGAAGSSRRQRGEAVKLHSWIAGCPGGGDPHLTSVGYFKAAEIKET